MQAAKRITAIFLGVLWLLPSVSLCAPCLHLATEHHGDPHPEEESHALTGDLAEPIFHDHLAMQADAPEHSHGAPMVFPQLTQRLGGEPGWSTQTRSLAPSLQRAPPPDLAPELHGLPLFTAHCYLLI